jgi:hypothetical protein
MKTILNRFFIVLTLLAAVDQAAAQGTAFTYQGQLQDNGIPANGLYDFKLQLYASSTNIGILAGPVTNTAVAVTNGLFTTVVDFGPAVFVGGSNWLHLAVQTNGGSNFIGLSPRQQLTPAPYSIFSEGANAAGLVGSIPSADFSGTYGDPVTLSSPFNTYSGNGANLSNVNASLLAGLAASAFWQTGGNAGTTGGANFLGTTDDQPLEMHVNSQRALRLEPDTTGSGSPNVIGGSPNNFMDAGDVIGGFIGGGGAVDYNGSSYPNHVAAYYGSVVGGYANTIVSFANTAFIGGGDENTVAGNSSVIGGGEYNRIKAAGDHGVIGGGYINTNSGEYATIPGGYGNLATGTFSFAAGDEAHALHQGAFVWADSQGSAFASTGNNQFLIRAGGGVGINMNDPGADSLSVGGTARMNDNDIYLGLSNDNQDGIGFYSSFFKPFGSFSFGPVLYGQEGGALGTTEGGLNPVLQWNNSSQVAIAVPGNAFGSGEVLMVVNAACDGNTWLNYSDRNFKENFAPTDARQVLDKVLALPVLTWNYKNSPTAGHLGPMAQDFHAAFGLNGTNDTCISTIDENGVALAAIQGLNQKLESMAKEKDAEIEILKAKINQVDALEKQLNDLKQIVQSLADRK